MRDGSSRRWLSVSVTSAVVAVFGTQQCGGSWLTDPELGGETMTNKDSPEVVKFMSQLTRLKDWIDDDPAGLPELAKNDEVLKKLCKDLHFVASFLKSNERRRRQLFAAPVDPKFLTAWRDYEERYESTIMEIRFSDLVADLEFEPSNVPKADFEWDFADDDAERQAGAIEEAIKFAQENADQDWRWDEDQDDFIQRIQDGVAAWDRLRQDTEFDLRGVFRRRELVPFVLVPRQVAVKYGSDKKLSMLKNLKQAHDAFVYGATYGALALMRSIMEAVLRDHYGVIGQGLDERINNARGRLPRGANADALHRLRRRANAILHLNLEKDEGLPSMDEQELEKEIVSLLFVLRALIEGAK
jgi:hypothetical protein